MNHSILNIDGELIPFNPDKDLDSTRKISALDRSYLYGDSLYEVIRTYEGKFFHLNEHLMRLAKSAELCHLKLSQSLSQIAMECERSLSAFRKLPGQEHSEAYCRVILSRGVGKIGFGEENLLTRTLLTILVQKLNTPGLEKFRKGYRFKIVDRIRNHPKALDPAMKSGNYLNNLLAYLEGTQQGYDDALLVDQEGFLTEGTTFNIFYVKNKIIATPPLEVGILDGVTRRHILKLAQNLGYHTREVRFPREYLYEADEVFMTSTIKEAFPVTQVDHIKYKAGPITLKLNEAFRKDVQIKLKLSQIKEAGT
jgi:branched-chain amino acid aminotransferase